MGLRIRSRLDPITVELDVEIDQAERRIPSVAVVGTLHVGDERHDRRIPIEHAVEFGDLVRLHPIGTGTGGTVDGLHVLIDAANARLRALQKTTPFGSMGGAQLRAIMVDKSLVDAFNVGADRVAVGGTSV